MTKSTRDLVNNDEQEQRFKELKEQSKKTSEASIRINTQIEQAIINRDKIMEQAKLHFGVSSLEELKALAEKWTQENQETLERMEKEIKNKAEEIKQKEAIIKKIQQGE